MVVGFLVAVGILALVRAAFGAARRRANRDGQAVVADAAAQEARIYRRLYGEHLGSAELVWPVDESTDETEARQSTLRAA